jgi:uncharacterized protein
MGSLLTALLGGVLIGLAGAALLLLEGRTAGISGAIGGLVAPYTSDRALRAAFLAGLAVTGAFAVWIWPSAFGAPVVRAPLLLISAGAIAGVGARLGGGCTSGHGVCGIGRMSRRSWVATLVFMATGVLAASAVRVAGIAS